MFSLICTSIVLFIFNYSNAQIRFESNNEITCVTPNRQQGVCIPMARCSPLTKLVNSRSFSLKDINYLTSSECSGTNNLYCCPIDLTERKSTTDNLFPAPGKCGIIVSDRIFGGNTTKIDEYPWTALVEFDKGNNNRGFECGGSLINEKYIVTAAHCIKRRGNLPDWTVTKVRLGEWDLRTDVDCEHEDCSDPPQDFEVEEVITHENYNPRRRSYRYDIALIRLSRKVTYTHWVQPICLPRTNQLRNTNYVGATFDVVGWGQTERLNFSPVKVRAHVNGISLAECNRIYESERVTLQESQMCAGGERGIDSCGGDSGGPLVGLHTSDRRPFYYLAGIVSFGPRSCGLAGWPGVYTKVSHFIDWIENNIRP